jgi:hypothetical protein
MARSTCLWQGVSSVLQVSTTSASYVYNNAECITICYYLVIPISNAISIPSTKLTHISNLDWPIVTQNAHFTTKKTTKGTYQQFSLYYESYVFVPDVSINANILIN